MSAYYITAGEFAQRGADNIPDELVSSAHLIYSSPATIDFNSPGARGFGVKRAGLAIPGSVMLLVAPGCCGRNTTLLSSLGYDERFFYLMLDETDIVVGRHLTKIPAACREVCEISSPTAVMICVTCVDALLGTDMERVCRKCADACGVPCVPVYMYALTREKRLAPMALARKTAYSLLEKQKRISDECALLGYFSPLYDTCELYALLRGAGIKKIHELGRCKDINEYHAISRANFNIVLNSEARAAALDMEERLGIPFIELVRMYDTERIHRQYTLLGQAIGAKLDDSAYYDKAKHTEEMLSQRCGGMHCAVGEMLNADSFELSVALITSGLCVSEIYGTVTERNFPFIRRLAEISPDTRIFSNLSPTMTAYECTSPVDIAIGTDAGYYHPDIPCIPFQDEEQPFGYDGVIRLYELLGEVRI